MNESIALGTQGDCPVCGQPGWVKTYTVRQVNRMLKAGNPAPGRGKTRHDIGNRAGIVQDIGRVCKF